MWKILVITSDNCAEAQRASHEQKNIHLQPTNLPLRSDLVRTPTSVAQGIWKIYFYVHLFAITSLLLEKKENKKGKKPSWNLLSYKIPSIYVPGSRTGFCQFCLFSKLVIYLSLFQSVNLFI